MKLQHEIWDKYIMTWTSWGNRFSSLGWWLKSLIIILWFWRDQMTTTEVNMARLYNWDVKRRQLQTAK